MEFVLFTLLIVIGFSIVSILLKKNFNLLITVLLTTVIVYFILYPKLSINSTLVGVKLFFTSVFPSLFCFLIICNLIISFNGIHIYSKILGKILCSPMKLSSVCSFPIIVSFLCGYPLGAKYSCDLYETGAISDSEFSRLINIASNPSPLFIVGVVGATMLKNPFYGYILLAANYLSCIAIGIIFRKKDVSNTTYKPILNNNSNFGSALKSSVENAIKTSLTVGGYITMFAVIIDIISTSFLFNYLMTLTNLNNQNLSILKVMALGLIEVTKGTYILTNSNLDINIVLILAGFLTAFSGLSIISQIHSFIYKYKFISLSKFIKIKVLQGIICSAFTIGLYNLLITKYSLETFNSGNSLTSSNILYIIIAFLIFLPTFFNKKSTI